MGFLICVEDAMSSYFLISNFGCLFITASVLLPSIVALIIRRWFENNYENHPVVHKLKAFCDSNTSWRVLASDINNEVSR